MAFIRNKRPVCPNCGRKIRNTLSLSEMIDKLKSLRMNPAFTFSALALLGIVTGLMSLLLGAAAFGLPMFRSYLSSPILLLLNLLPPMIIIFITYIISRRAWIAFAFPSFFIIALSAAAFFKFQVRGDSLLASDIAHFREAGSVLSSYELTMNWKIMLSAAFLVLGILFCVIALRYKPSNARIRIIAAVAIVGASAALYIFTYSSARLYDKVAADVSKAGWSAARRSISTGFIYPFIHSISDLQDKPPDFYDRQLAAQTLLEYDNADIPKDKQINIICLMLEAYSDLSAFNALSFTEDVYGPLHRLQQQSISGTLITNVFGGGTIDTERLFLTGNTHLSTYRSSTNSYVQYLKHQGYQVEGLHAGDMWFYDRRPVNAALGFERYYFMEDFENGNRSDDFFFSTILSLYEARDLNRPYFSFNLSYQNHGAYDSTQTSEPHYIEKGGMSDEAFNILNNYLSGIYDTTLRIESFLETLHDEAEPVVVVVFGDHMPWLGVNDHVYEEMGVNVDGGEEEGYYNYYSTPFIIWANESAKKVLDNEFIGDGGSFSPCFLMGEVFQLCSWEGDRYMQALRELKPTLDVINPISGVFREDGALTMQLTPKARAAYEKLRIVEHYRLMNFFY